MTTREPRPGRAAPNPYAPPLSELPAPTETPDAPSRATRLLFAHGVAATLLWGFLSVQGSRPRHVLSTIAAIGFIVLSSSRFSSPTGSSTWRSGYMLCVGAFAFAMGRFFGPSEASALHILTAAALLLATHGTPGRGRYWIGATLVSALDVLILVYLVRRIG